MPSHGISKDEVKRRAEIRAHKAEVRRLDAVRALEANQAERDAEQAKTMRLRALRLAKEADAAKTEAKKPEPVKKARKPRAARSA
jgi:hypothetical protein